MWSQLVITCIIFQTAVAIFLLNGVRRNNDIDKQLTVLLCILLVHLSTKFLLLGVLKNTFLYSYIPTGFGLAYGPLLLILARAAQQRPIRPRTIFFQFLPFLLCSIIYIVLVIGSIGGGIARYVIIGYTSWYEWLVLGSLFVYPVYVRLQLRGLRSPQARLVGQMGGILLIGISAGMLLFALHGTAMNIPGFDLRLLPYICFSAIPVLILRYRLQGVAEAGPVLPAGGTELLRTGAAKEAGSTGVVRSTEEAGPTGVAVADEGVAEVRRYEKSGLDIHRMDEYEAALATFMRKSRIYLDPDLSLELLATRMKMSRHHLTQLLNERVQKNFYGFVNEYRIGEAIERLSDPANGVNILSLAFDCGFNSRSSFNSHFKKITGHTPSGFRKIQLEDKRASAAAGRRARKPARLVRDAPAST